MGQNNVLQDADNFQNVIKIGEGTYGIVYKAHDATTGKEVALKKIRLHRDTDGIPSTTLREISILKMLDHKNIIQLFDVVVSETSLYMVFEYLNMDLRKLMDKKSDIFTPQLVKSYMFQLFSAIACCHTNRILHRDLKPQNLLVDAYGHIKLADFGLARMFSVPTIPYTHEIVTLWYRAPEVMLGTKLYSTGMDIWSLGCIFAEMILKKALFMGDSEIDQLYRIFRTLGTPNESNWRGVSQLPDFRTKFPKWESHNLPDTLVKHEAYDLFKMMIVYDPNERISAKNAIFHSYFSNIEMVKHVDLPRDN